jgi:hypothetical protein
MDEQPRWRTESRWILSSIFTYLAILVVFWGLVGIWGSYLATQATSDYSRIAIDRVGNVLTLAMIMPLALAIFLFWYVLAGVVGFRLLVPTFAGLPPRAVGIACTTWAIGLGAMSVFPDPLAKVQITITGMVWGLLMPLPGKSLLGYGPLAGSAVIGLGFVGLSTWGGLAAAIIWTLWRLRKGHALDAAVTAAFAASLPAVLVVHDWQSIGGSRDAALNALQVGALLAVAVAGTVLAVARRPQGQVELES